MKDLTESILINGNKIRMNRNSSRCSYTYSFENNYSKFSNAKSVDRFKYQNVQNI